MQIGREKKEENPLKKGPTSNCIIGEKTTNNTRKATKRHRRNQTTQKEQPSQRRETTDHLTITDPSILTCTSE